MLHKLIDFCFDGEEKKLHFGKLLRETLLKEKINGQLCLSKQDAVNYILSKCYFTMAKNLRSNQWHTYWFWRCCILCQPVFKLLWSQTNKRFLVKGFDIKDHQKKDLIKTRKLCNFFCFINDLSAINDAGIFESDFKNM